MRIYDTDQQQSEALQQLWYKNNKLIVFGLIVLFISLWGYNKWLQTNKEHHQIASLQYQSLLQFEQNHQRKKSTQKANEIIKNFKSTPYADLSRLTLAKYEIQDQHLKKAEKIYQSILNNSSHDALKIVTASRLANVYLELKQPQKAIDIINQQPHRIFPSRFDEIKGDALSMMSKKATAYDLYQAAIDEMPHDPIWAMAIERIKMKQSALFSAPDHQSKSSK